MEQLESISDRVLLSKINEDALNGLVEAYRPFIASEISKTINEYVDPKLNEFMSTGMIAFVEAIRCYDAEKGAFIPLAKRVIKQRVIDDLRSKNRCRIVTDCLDDSLEIQQVSMKKYAIENEKYERQLVIEEYRQELATWGIDFFSLTKASPKSKKNKDLLKSIAAFIVEKPELLKQVLETKRIPINEIEARFKMNRKKIDRGRVFIIACILLREPQYVMLRDYIE